MEALVNVSPAEPSSSLAADMELVHNSIIGHLELSPAYVSHFVNIECKDKLPSETYRDYCEKVHGSSLSAGQWKNYCNFSWRQLQISKDPNDFDITALLRLFHVLFKAKRDTRDTRQFMVQLQNLANLRNKVMHNKSSAKDPRALRELEAALHDFIKEAGAFYALTSAEVQGLLVKLKQDVEACFSPGKKKQLYACSYTLQEGWITMEKFHEHLFTTQNLMFKIDRVRRSDVFYSPEVLLRGDKEMKPVPFWEIFKQGERITIVCGEAGSGKSTLLENIALQFIKRKPCSPGLLQDFQLMVYVQCRDPYCKTLKDVIQQQLFNVCTVLGVDDVLGAVLKLRTLFVIDGYDEYQQSMTVVQDVIKEVWRADCKVIISTRPRAAKQLRNMLSDRNICYLEFRMAPLVALEKQLDFLSKYEPHLQQIRTAFAGALLATFKSIPEHIRSLFSEPIKLLQVCSVFEKQPDRIKNWKTIGDVTEDVFLIYRTLVEKKLAEYRYPNFDIVIDDIFQVICKLAFDFIRSNIFSFTEVQFKDARRSCLSKLREDHGIVGLDVEVILTSVMKTTSFSTPQGDVIYSFNHRSDQECFASRHVVHLLETSTDSLREILQGGTQTSQASNIEADTRTSPQQTPHSTITGFGAQHEEQSDFAEEMKKTMETQLPSLIKSIIPKIPDNLPPMNPFVEVLQYVIRDLSARNRSLLQQRSPEIKEVLEEMGANFSTWRDMVLNSPSDTWLVRSAAQAAIENNTKWKMGSGLDISAAALMLRHVQPRLLEVRLMPSDTVNPERWTQVIQRRDGDLKLHLLGSRCWDHYLAPLLNSRCRLVYFQGKVTTSSSLDALASVACGDTVFQVSVPAPLNFGSLENKCKELWVYSPLQESDVRGESASVLPSFPRPKLFIDDVPSESWMKVVQTITKFAPFGNRYESLHLRYCELTDAELDQVVDVLQRRGVRTAGDGRSRWVKPFEEGFHELILPDDLTKLTTLKLDD